MRYIGGNLGQRERVLYTTWALAFLWGVAKHYGFACDDTVLTLLVSTGAGVVASYTYKGSATATPAATPPAGG